MSNFSVNNIKVNYYLLIDVFIIGERNAEKY